MKGFLLGILFIGVGFSMIYFSSDIMKLMGSWKWAEDYLGGTRQGYSIIGFLLIVFGFLVMFGVIE